MYEIVLGRSRSKKEKYGLAGTIFVGKQYIQMGQFTSLANPLYLDIGSPHVILVAGKRGSGKCVTGDTLITLDDGECKPIAELEQNKNNVLGLDNNLKINKLAKTEFFKRTVNKVLKITMRSGKEIKLTPEHPLLTVLGWKEAQELEVGSRVAAPRILNTFGGQELSECKIKLLAYLIAEGCLRQGFVLFSNSDTELINDFETSVKEFDSNLRVDQHSKPGCYRVSQIEKRYVLDESARNDKGQFITGGVRYQKSSINQWMRDIGLYDLISLDKFIPNCIFKLPKYQLALFLNRLFSCDGSIFKHKTTHGAVWQVSYSSSSEQIIRQVQHLLLRFGVLSRLRIKKVKYLGEYRKSFELEIGTDNLTRFIDEIGFFGAKQKLQQQALIELSQITRNPNVDTIPKEVWDTYRPNNWVDVGRAFGYAHPKALRSSINYAPSRQKLEQIALCDQNSSMYLLATSDIFWDEIVRIDELDGEIEVYDISVPESHNFVANDIIVHNSYTLGSIAEGLFNLPEDIAENISCLIFDTMGIYWTMKYPNYRDDALLQEWNLKPAKLHPVVYVPIGIFDDYEKKGIGVDKKFSIRPKDVGLDAWVEIFNIDLTKDEGLLLERILESLRRKEYSIDDILVAIKLDKKSDERIKAILENRFVSAGTWGIFDAKGTELEDLFKGGQTTVLDLSAYSQIDSGDRIKALVIKIISERILKSRLLARKEEEVELIESGAYLKEASAGSKAPLIWILIDEGHDYLPNDRETLASEPLIRILREGRQPGISLVVATQQPGSVAADLLTQADVVISHRLTAKVDVEALSSVMQSYLPFSLQRYIDELPSSKGAAIVLDDKLEKIYPIQVRPRFSWHGGSDPSAMSDIEAGKNTKK